MDISWDILDPATAASCGVQQMVDLYFSVPNGSEYSLVVEGRSGDVMGFSIWDTDAVSSLYQSSPEGDFEISGQFIGSGNYAFLVQLIGTSSHPGSSLASGADFSFAVHEGVVAVENTTWGRIKSLYR